MTGNFFEIEKSRQITEILERCLRESIARCVYLIDKAGQIISANGEMRDIDGTALAALTAGNVAATDELARTIGEKEFSLIFHEGLKDHIHISIVAQRLILIVVFDKTSSIGLVRLRVKKACEELAKSMQ